MNGYLHPSYARSLAEFGVPHELHRSQGWILKRQIRGFDDHDAMGVYPLFACQDWSKLYEDLDEISHELISLTLVADPFGDYDVSQLHTFFEDVVVPFKGHFIVDLSRPIASIVSDHHRRNSKKVLQRVRVERCAKPPAHLCEWFRLYENLIRRHQIVGIPAFSRDAFAKQLDVPGIVAFQQHMKGLQ